jgi:cyclohexanecarboxylate-CoA ligase
VFFETTLTRERIRRETAAGTWSGRMLHDDLADAVRRHPAKTAIIDARGRYTYAELGDAADRAALGLLDAGVRPGDVVTVQLPNWNEFIVAMLAIERIGAVINPIAPIFRDREVALMLGLARPTAVITAERFNRFEHAAMFDRLLADMDGVRCAVVVGGEARGRWTAWDGLLARGGAAERDRRVLDVLGGDPDAISQLIFTSGTTGEPKGALHTPNTLGCAARGAIQSQGLTADDVCHMASTFAHQTGFVYGARLPIHLGATAVYQEAWNGDTFVELVSEHAISYTMGATPFVVDFLRALGSRTERAASLRTFISAGAPIPRPVAEEMRAKVATRLAAGWGMTENGLVTALFPGDPPDKAVTSDGRPFPGMEIAVRTPEGTDAAPGTEGDLYARGPFTFVGYVQGREFTERYFAPGEWFSTGDLAYVDGDGYVRITGRSKDIIIRGGEKVPVKEVEDLILRHAAVRQVAVIGVPDERLGERARACVVLEDAAALDLDGLRAHLRERGVTPQFWPEQLEVLPALPTTPSGKVQKFRLREAAAAAPVRDPTSA